MNAPAQLDERLPAVLRTVSESFATHAVRPDQLHTMPVDGIRILGVMEYLEAALAVDWRNWPPNSQLEGKTYARRFPLARYGMFSRSDNVHRI
jgi:hypothetical protein